MSCYAWSKIQSGYTAIHGLMFAIISSCTKYRRFKICSIGAYAVKSAMN